MRTSRWRTNVVLAAALLILAGRSAWAQGEDAREMWQRIERTSGEEGAKKQRERYSLLQEFLRRFSSDARVPEALYELAEMQREANAIEEALAGYRRVVAEHPQSPLDAQSLFWQGRIAYLRGDRKSALDYFRQAVKTGPKTPFFEQVGVIAQWIEGEKEGDPAAVREVFQKTLDALASVRDQSFLITVEFSHKEKQLPIDRLVVAYQSPYFMVSCAYGALLYDGKICRVYLKQTNTIYTFEALLPDLQWQIGVKMTVEESGKGVLKGYLGYSLMGKPLTEMRETMNQIPRLHTHIAREGDDRLMTILANSGTEGWHRIALRLDRQSRFRDGSCEGGTMGIRMTCEQPAKAIPEIFNATIGKGHRQVAVTLDNLCDVAGTIYDAYHPSSPNPVVRTFEDIIGQKEGVLLLAKAVREAVKKARQVPLEDALFEGTSAFCDEIESNLIAVKSLMLKHALRENFLAPDARKRILAFVQMLQSAISQSGKTDEETIRRLTEALGKEPSNIRLLFERAEVYRQTGDRESALGDLRKIIALEEKNDEAHALIGELFLLWEEDGKDEEHRKMAEEFTNRALALNDRNSRALVTSGDLILKKTPVGATEVDQARRQYAKALKADEGYLDAYRAVARLCRNIGKPEAAVMMLNEAKGKIRSDSPAGDISSVYLGLAQLYDQSGSPSKAVKTIEEFLRAYPSHRERSIARMLHGILAIQQMKAGACAPELLAKIRGEERELLDKIASKEDREIDLGRTALTLARLVDPEIDVEAYVTELDAIAREVKARIGDEKDPRKIVDIVNAYLFKERKAVVASFQKALADGQGSFLPRVLETMDGDCLGFTTLYLAIGERLNLPLYGVEIPQHIFVRYDDGKIQRNVETTKMGEEISSREAYVRWLKALTGESDDVLAEEMKEIPSFENLSKKEVIADILRNRGGYFIDVDRREDATESFAQSIRLKPRSPAFVYGFAAQWHLERQAYDKAVPLLMKAADRYRGAQRSLGLCYLLGSGVPKDEREAVKWFRKAAEQGDTTAQYNLGVCLLNGQGVAKDAKAAVAWFHKAADQGDADAQRALAICYRDGTGVEKDAKEEIRWLTKAAEGGNAKALEALKKIHRGADDE